MSTEPDDMAAAERQEFVEAFRAFELENARLRRVVEAVAACHVCSLCAESARLILDLLRKGE